MQFTRPASPLSLEVQPCLASESDEDGLLASDDELDDSARAAKRQRIERLAKSYLQGTPLFIMSATLEGPFDREWVNPWRKVRGSVRHKGLHGTQRGGKTLECPVVPESESPRKTHDNVLQNIAMYPNETSLESFTTSGSSGMPESCEQLRSPTSVYCRSRYPKSDPSQNRNYTHAGREDHGAWLKTAPMRSRPGTSNPPTSTSVSISTKLADLKKRRKINDTSASVNSHVSSAAETSRRRSTPHSSVREKRKFHRSESTPVARSLFPEEYSSPMRHRISHSELSARRPVTSKTEPSSVHVASSSHRPRFEYRLIKDHDPTHNERPRCSDTSIPAVASNDMTKSGEDTECSTDRRLSAANGTPAHSTGPASTMSGVPVPHAASNSDVSEGQKSNFSVREENRDPSRPSNEKSPSSQKCIERPDRPDLAESAESLRSATMRQGNSTREADISPEATFSTQAAVLLAQMSFQNDLESPERNSPITTENRQAFARSHSSSSAHRPVITPLSKASSPAKVVGNDRSSRTTKNNTPIISTQRMIDEITPCAFSTEKKHDRQVMVPGGSTMSSSKKRKTLSFAPLPQSVQHAPKVGEQSEDVHSHFGNPCLRRNDAVAMDEIQQETRGNDERDDTQMSALPLTFDGSTPPTAQDGEGLAVDFSLSEAITDVGSWLQTGWDLSKDLKSFSDPIAAPSSSAAARRSAGSNPSTAR